MYNASRKLEARMLYLIGIPFMAWFYFRWQKAPIDWDAVEDRALDECIKQDRQMDEIHEELKRITLIQIDYERRILNIGNWVTLAFLIPVPIIEFLRYPNLAEFYFGWVCLGYAGLHIALTRIDLSFAQKVGSKISAYKRRGLK